MVFTPVTLSFLSTLEDLLADIFNKILMPILMTAFDFLWDLLYGMFIKWISIVFFKLFTMLLKVLYIIEKIFDVHGRRLCTGRQR